MARTYPYLLQQFLDRTGWPPPRDTEVAARMQTALAFLQAHLSGWVDLPLDATDRGYRKHGFNPFAFKIQGKVTKLIGAMQAIDFNWPVQNIELAPPKRVRRYGKAGEPRGQPAAGLWFTDPDVPAARLALPPDQNVPYGYEVVTRAPALSSIAGDLLVDWNMDPDLKRPPTQGIDYHYRSGGGVQYVVANAAKVLRPL